jgi:hypothetical protein
MLSTMTPETIDLEFTPRFRSSVVLVPVADEAVLFDQATGALHQLDRIAAVVCGCFDGASSLRDIAGDLAEAFAVEREIVAGDVLRLTRGLGELGVLIDVVGSSPTVEEPHEEC